jgi:hypothetical protein
MKAKIISLTLALAALSFSSIYAQSKSIVGTWKLISQKVTNPDGSTYTADSAAVRQVKIYTPTMFVTVAERKIPELNNQTLVIKCAGGHYTLKGEVYEEITEFASYKDYKGMKVKFILTMEGGKVHTIGAVTGADMNVTTYDEWYIKTD